VPYPPAAIKLAAPPLRPEARRRARGIVEDRIDERWAAERADDTSCGERLGGCLRVDRTLVLARGGCVGADLVAAALGVPARPERTEDGRATGGAAARDVARGVRLERRDDGRPAGWLRESEAAEDAVGRALRAAGVTAVGVMLSSDLQLAGGAQVR
jgi:hypothetical protein